MTCDHYVFIYLDKAQTTNQQHQQQTEGECRYIFYISLSPCNKECAVYSARTAESEKNLPVGVELYVNFSTTIHFDIVTTTILTMVMLPLP
jgi:hypothetical protein